MSIFGADAIFGDVVSDGLASIQSALSQYGGTGTDPGVGFGVAIRGLQAAGNAAVAVVGPGIDAFSGSDPKAMIQTHRVWARNGDLANVPSTDSATRDNWQSAVTILSDMANQYGVANRYAKSLKKAKPKSAYVAGTTPPVTSAVAYVAPVAAAPAAPAAPTVVVVQPPAATALATLPGGVPLDTTTTVALGAGGVLGLVLGGAVGLRAGAHVGLYVGGPVGALFGAAAAWALVRVLNPPPSPAVVA